LSLATETQYYRRHKEADQSLKDQHLSRLCFYENIRAIFWGQKMFIKDVFVTQLSSIALQIVWVTTNRCFISDMPSKRKAGISERQNVLLAYLAAHADKRHHFVRFLLTR
jgi:hypothetical protein